MLEPVEQVLTGMSQDTVSATLMRNGDLTSERMDGECRDDGSFVKGSQVPLLLLKKRIHYLSFRHRLCLSFTSSGMTPLRDFM